MSRKLKFALAALLGFSTACSSVKNAPREKNPQAQDADSVVVKGYSPPPRAVVMYGVPIPKQDSIRKKRLEKVDKQRSDSLPPASRDSESSPTSK